MTMLNYKIEDDHFIVTINNRTKYFFLGNMDGVTAEVIDTQILPRGHIILKIVFPEIGLVTFPIYYRTLAQSSVAKYRANEVIEKLLQHIKSREIRTALNSVKVLENALLAQLKK